MCRSRARFPFPSPKPRGGVTMQSRHECFMCGVWDGWVVSNPYCPPACVRAAFVTSAQLRVRTRILRWVWRRSNPAAARGLTQSVSLSGVRLVDGWILSNLDLCDRVRVAA
eukprot:scaffold58763_cov81-Phaeocystis_antarctica.AAC.1